MVNDEPEWASAHRWWYSQTYILLEMVKCLQHRELVFLEKKNPSTDVRRPRVIRCCPGYTVDILKSNLKAFRVLDFPYINFYYSLMHLEKMPLFSYAPAQRAESYKVWTAGGYKEQWQGFDFGLDLDGDTVEKARQDLLKVKKLFDQYKIPYSVRFSGQRGFHLCVEHQWLPQLPEERIVRMCGELATMMMEIDKIKSVDDTIFDNRRVLKLPYSFDRGNICLPLDDYQIENFRIDMVKPESVIKSVKIMNRGVLERYADQPVETARASFLKLAENFIDVKPYQVDR